MTFDELKKIFKSELQIIRLSDIARELGVSPQVVNNWKMRNQVPYNYVKVLKELLSKNNSLTNQKLIINNSLIESLVKIFQEYSDIISFLLSKLKYTLLICFLSCFTIYLLGVYVFEHIYYSEIKIIPSSSITPNSSTIKTLADRIGIGMNEGGNFSAENNLLSTQMVPIYLDSKYLSEKIIEKKFFSDIYGKKIELYRILASVKDSSINITEHEKRKLIDKLQESVNHKIEKNGITRIISVKFTEPKLCVEILNEYMREIKNIFKINFKEQNIDKKTFLEGRLSGTQKELTSAENDLKVFREKNREIFKSPELQTQQNRLIRDVSVLTEIYINLRSEYEMFLVNEKENLNIFKVIDPPELPLGRISPNNTKNVMGMFIISFFLMNFIFITNFYLGKNIIYVKKIYEILKASLKND
jgi:hypothetical protein